jgi:hypothetical protein
VKITEAVLNEKFEKREIGYVNLRAENEYNKAVEKMGSISKQRTEAVRKRYEKATARTTDVIRPDHEPNTDRDRDRDRENTEREYKHPHETLKPFKEITQETSLRAITVDSGSWIVGMSSKFNMTQEAVKTKAEAMIKDYHLSGKIETYGAEAVKGYMLKDWEKQTEIAAPKLRKLTSDY